MSDAPTATGPSVASRRATEMDPGLRLRGRRIEVAPHNCFACGTLNAHGLRLTLHAQDGRCWTELALERDFEGWDGIAHGGIVCTILDEVMAWATIEHETWGLTARMAVNFKRPVPIGRAIRAEGWVDEANRRLIRTQARIVDTASGEVLATADGTYIAAPAERREELRRRYDFRLVDEASAKSDRAAGAVAQGAGAPAEGR